MLSCGRVFLIGCRDSGTTLLQSLLSVHPNIFVCPSLSIVETLGSLPRLRCPACRRYERRALHSQSRRLPGKVAVPKRNFREANLLASLDFIDHLAQYAEKPIWVDRILPDTLVLNRLEACVPGVRFVHVVRNGEENIALLYERRLKERALRKETSLEKTTQENMDLDACLQEWQASARIELECHGRPHHLIIRYEDLMQRQEETLLQFHQFAHVPPVEPLSDTRENETWDAFVQE